jgi:hypothetical protein
MQLLLRGKSVILYILERAGDLPDHLQLRLEVVFETRRKFGRLRGFCVYTWDAALVGNDSLDA